MSRGAVIRCGFGEAGIRGGGGAGGPEKGEGDRNDGIIFCGKWGL